MAVSRARVQRRPVHGLLLLDKPIGLSSNQALQKAKWLLRAEKAGHTGTLDPLATGVLPLCFGAATKFSQIQLDADKTYEAVARLGARTSTGDAEGQVIEQRPVQVTAQDLARVAAQFTGAIRQIPPMHSALKKDGKALYEYAREGVEVDRAPRDVTVYQLDIAPVDAVSIRIVTTVSKGVYIRTLAEDIGAALGCGAYLTQLRRTATGGFDLAQCVTLQELEALDEPQRLARLLPPEALLAGHTAIVLPGEEAGRFLTGLRRRGPWPDAGRVAVFGDAPRALLGTAHVAHGELIPDRLLSPVELEQMLRPLSPAGEEARNCPLPLAGEGQGRGRVLPISPLKN